MSLAGRVALVTGGTRGLGHAISKELAERGATVVLNYCDRQDDAEAAWNDIGGNGFAIAADISKLDAVEDMFDKVRSRCGPIDILVCNAGISRDSTVAKMSPTQWQAVLDVNLTGLYNCCHTVIGEMLERQHGRIIAISSVVGEIGGIGVANYAASKAGIIGFVRALAHEVAKSGITVNAVSPGYMDAGLLATIPDEIRAKIKERIPMKRFGRPEDIARAVRFLAEEGDYITGTTLRVNGGLAAG